jgi:hypothetical protein
LSEAKPTLPGWELMLVQLRHRSDEKTTDKKKNCNVMSLAEFCLVPNERKGTK